jgi:hypothetical protein
MIFIQPPRCSVTRIQPIFIFNFCLYIYIYILATSTAGYIFFIFINFLNNVLGGFLAGPPDPLPQGLW